MTVYRDGALVLHGFVGDTFFDEGFTSGQVLAALAEHGRDQDITVRLNSPGGIAWEGVAIYNALAAHRGNVRIEVEAIAASAGSVIAMAGDEIVMRAGALMMMHDPAAVTFGTAAEHDKSREFLDKLGDSMASIYAERSGHDAAAVRDAMRGELWLTAAEAVAQGYADEAEGAKAKAVAAFDYRIYANAPQRLVALAKRKNWSIETNSQAASAPPQPAQQKETPMPERTAAEATATANPETAAPAEAPAETPAAPAAPEAQAQPDATGEALARAKAILALDEAKGREPLAQTLAFDPEVSVEKAKAWLAAAPKASATPTIAERAADPLAGGHPIDRAPDASNGWDEAVAKVNKQFGLAH